MKKIRVTIWNEFKHEKQQDAVGDLIRSFYPEGLHKTLAENLADESVEIRATKESSSSQNPPRVRLEFPISIASIISMPR